MVAPLSEMRDKSPGKPGPHSHTNITRNTDIYSHIGPGGAGPAVTGGRAGT